MRTALYPCLMALLVAGLGASVEAQASEGDWKKTDPAGDWSLRSGGQSTPAAPAPPVYDSVDITGLEIEDRDGESFLITLRTKAPLGLVRPPSVGSNFHLGTVTLTFQLPGTTAIGMVRLLVYSTVENNAQVAWIDRANACARDSMESYGCGYGANEPEVRIGESGGILIIVAKSVFVADTQRQWGPKNLPARLNAGDEISKLVIRSVTTADAVLSPFRATYEDVAPDGAAWPNYRLRFGSSLPDLRLNTTHLGVIAGEENALEIGLKNLGDRKRLINLTAEIAESQEPGWKVGVTPFVTVAGKNDTKILLRLTPPKIGAGTTDATVRIRAIVVSEGGDEASLMIRFEASPPIDKGSSKYYVHSKTYYSSPYSDLYASIDGTYGGVSRAETDPSYPDQFHLSFRGGLGYNGISVHSMMTEAFPNPVRILGSEKVKARLSIDSPHAIAGKLSVGLSSGFNSQPVALLEKDVSLNAGKQDIDLEGPVAAQIKRLAAGTALWVDIRFKSDSPLAIAAGTMAPRIKLLPKASWFELPVERDRESELVVKGPRVVLAVVGETDEFINAGRNQIFEMDLRNEEFVLHRVEVMARNVTEGWTVEVLPAPRFALKGNESAHIGIRVIAPANAKEGDRAEPRIVVRGIENVIDFQVIRLSLTVVSVDIPNETFTFAAEDKGKLDQVAKAQSPGISPWALAVVLAVIVGVRRRNGRTGT